MFLLVGFLFDMVSEFSRIRQSYIKVAEEEIRYRQLTISWRDTLEDTFSTCYLLAMRDVNDKRFGHLQKGISNINNFILGKFHLDEAIICAAKVAYLSRILVAERYSVQRYSGPGSVEKFIIDNPNYNKLNKLRKSFPEAFFYWHHALSL